MVYKKLMIIRSNKWKRSFYGNPNPDVYPYCLRNCHRY